MLPELIELNQIRLEEDLLYSELAARIGMEVTSLNRLLRGERGPRDRTLYKIRRYLDQRKATTKRQTRRRVA